MLTAIRNMTEQGYDAGLKISGGIANVQQANEYMSLAENIMGKGWLTVKHFRIGSSRLI